MNQNLLHPVLTDRHSLISRGDLNKNVRPIIAVLCNELRYFANRSGRELSRRSLIVLFVSGRPRIGSRL